MNSSAKAIGMHVLAVRFTQICTPVLSCLEESLYLLHFLQAIPIKFAQSTSVRSILTYLCVAQILGPNHVIMSHLGNFSSEAHNNGGTDPRGFRAQGSTELLSINFVSLMVYTERNINYHSSSLH
ncbi:hypothetical protein ACJX0J_020726, partial [Zea mays]